MSLLRPASGPSPVLVDDEAVVNRFVGNVVDHREVGAAKHEELDRWDGCVGECLCKRPVSEANRLPPVVILALVPSVVCAETPPVFCERQGSISKSSGR
jgi:hypothetical protein